MLTPLHGRRQARPRSFKRTEEPTGISNMTRCSMMLPAPPVPSSYAEDRQRQIAKNRLRLQQIGFCEAVEALRHQVRPPPSLRHRTPRSCPDAGRNNCANIRHPARRGKPAAYARRSHPRKTPGGDRGQENPKSSHGGHCVLPGCLPRRTHRMMRMKVMTNRRSSWLWSGLHGRPCSAKTQRPSGSTTITGVKIGLPEDCTCLPLPPCKKATAHT